MKSIWIALGLSALLSGCGAVYVSPSVSEQTDGAKVRVVPLNPESVLIANRSSYRPQQLPAVFFQNAGGASGSARGVGVLPEPAFGPQGRPAGIEMRLPPPSNPGAYEIGVGDVLVLATPQAGNTVEELTGLLAAQSRRQGYTVQDDGAIAIPDVGRVMMVGLTLEEAEAELFQKLVENQIDPSFSIEVAEFNSKRVSVGGAVKSAAVVPVTLTPLTLNEALAAAGGVDAPDRDFVTLRIYRNGQLYQLPLTELPNNPIRLLAGDSVFVDTDYELEQAQAYFQEQIRLAEFRQGARVQALNELNAAVGLRRAALNEERSNYQTRLELDSVDRDYVYLTGEVETQSRYPLPFGRTATLADALYSQGGLPTETGNPSQIYVLRGSSDPAEFGAVTAWHLNAKNASNFLLATRLELRPNDMVFVAEQPITRWNRALQQVLPSLLSSTVAAAK